MDGKPPSLEKLMGYFGAGTMIGAAIKTGLVKAMVEDPTPRSSNELAQASGMKERYVRELLHGLTVSGYFVASPSLKEDPDYNAPLKFSIHPDFVEEFRGSYGAAILEFLPNLIADGYEKTLECFPINGPKGVPYEAYADVHASIDYLSETMFGRTLLPGFVPLLPEEIRKGLESGIKVADVGCGHGLATRILARAFPNSEFIGADLCREAVEGGAAKAKAE